MAFVYSTVNSVQLFAFDHLNRMRQYDEIFHQSKIDGFHRNLRKSKIIKNDICCRQFDTAAVC